MFSILLQNKRVALLIGGLAIIAIAATLFAVISAGSLSLGGKSTNKIQPPSAKGTQADKPSRDFSLLIPGKSTLNNVLSSNGKPLRTEQKSGGEYLYYSTQYSDEEDFVFLQNNIVSFALQNVFENQSLSEYTSLYGSPALTVYPSSEPTWPFQVFLKNGVATQNSLNDVIAALYFVPQNADSFMKNVASRLDLSKTADESGPNEEY